MARSAKELRETGDALSRNAVALREASDAARERGAILKRWLVQQVTQQVRTSSKPPQPRSAERIGDKSKRQRRWLIEHLAETTRERMSSYLARVS
jgi:hypothetical protein